MIKKTVGGRMKKEEIWKKKMKDKLWKTTDMDPMAEGGDWRSKDGGRNKGRRMDRKGRRK